MPRKSIAKGSKRQRSKYDEAVREVSFRIDDETFEQIRDIAVKEDSSVSAVIRDLIELGLETLSLDLAQRINHG